MKTTPLAECAKVIQTGDLLGWTPTSAEGLTIARISGSPFSHVGMAAWLQVPFRPWQLCSLDMLRGQGGVVFPLGYWVRKFPGVIHVFRADPDDRYREQWEAAGAVEYWLRHYWGEPYGDDSARRALWGKLPILRWFRDFWPSWRDDDLAAEDVYCSTSVAMATQVGGRVDSVLRLAPGSTWPKDLVQSPFYGGPILCLDR